MKAFVGITDRNWFDLLSRRPQLDEVNFWQLGDNSQFQAVLGRHPDPDLQILKPPPILSG